MRDKVPLRPQIAGSSRKVLVLFGTRPEIIKLAPIIGELRKKGFEPIVVSSSQHTQLLRPFLKMFDVRTDHDLRVMRADQTPNNVCSRVVAKLDGIISSVAPDMIMVQGDTTTTFAGAVAGFNRGIPIAHVEAGLRSGNIASPFPEEMNRRLVSQLSSLHFAATDGNRDNLLQEGVRKECITVTGNPVVDSLRRIAAEVPPTKKIEKLIAKTVGMKRLLLTTHRRESFGPAIAGNLRALRDFIKHHQDTCLIFPVHPNPNVRKITNEIMAGAERIILLEPLGYQDFIALMKAAWLIVSDSGGVQEEAPSLGKPLLILRENTERPEAVKAGIAKLVGDDRGALRRMLEENYQDEKWIRKVASVPNPFGDGRSAARIVKIIERELAFKT